ncbi:MAG TPA: hypothetical protein VJR25_04275 [Microbacterium sp.]|uniref:three-helix bundle dimerization domain-containing protein n=1 Tax=Microbacterium sp. TaxID=51671 RepID=UPI002B46B219|nr:hypothetical protein [Microbacterium sp.]HKT55967.1 hypothetical protein [Microbacterium sp.]
MPRELVNEDKEAADIVERLSARYPHIPVATVEQFVAEARRGFATATVRDFVSVFVEREARARLESVRPA